MGVDAHSVSSISERIKELFESEPELGDVWVEGEVSNCRPYASGHWYFSLKDEDASISCVMWKYQAARQVHLPSDGGKFLLHGQISVYPAQGRYQFYVDHVEPAGQGELHRQFEAIKAKLDAEGLFDPVRKRALPAYPMRIGVVTSRQAAALRDVCNVLERRWPVAEVLLSPTSVQGERAPAEIVRAIERIGQTDVDLVIVTRGGGSLEDLWAFNDEDVARAIAACPQPVIAGVGHEIDFSIADFVADVRAPTPSAAAELATPDIRDLRLGIDGLRMQLEQIMRMQIESESDLCEQLRHRLSLASPLRTVGDHRLRVEEMGDRLERAQRSWFEKSRSALDLQSKRLMALSPDAVIARGYAHVSRSSDGRTVSKKADAPAGEGLRIRVSDGDIETVVAGQASLFDS